MKRKLPGQHIVVDQEICHGAPTFRGTRIMVATVLDQVARGMSWDAIIDAWDCAITKEAITEALHLANDVFRDHIGEYELEHAST